MSYDRCEHKRRAVRVKTESGKTFALQCPDCTYVICWIGDCPGCGMQEEKLPHVVEGGVGNLNWRYCSERCGSEHQKELRADARARIKEFKGRQTRFPGVE